MAHCARAGEFLLCIICIKLEEKNFIPSLLYSSRLLCDTIYHGHVL